MLNLNDKKIAIRVQNIIITQDNTRIAFWHDVAMKQFNNINTECNEIVFRHTYVFN